MCVFNANVVLSDTVEHKKRSSSGHHWHAHEEKKHNRNMQSVPKKAHLSNSDSYHSLSHFKGKANISPGSGQRILETDKRNSKDSRNYGSHHRKDSVISDRKHHSSTDVVDSRFRDNVNGLQYTSHGYKSAHRRSTSADSRSKAKVKEDIHSPVFQENLSSSALQERMEKKLRWISSLPHNMHQQCNGKKVRGPAKTDVSRQSYISSTVEHKKQMPSSVENGMFTYFILFYALLVYIFSCNSTFDLSLRLLQSLAVIHLLLQ